jgi:hypothetical protein
MRGEPAIGDSCEQARSVIVLSLKLSENGTATDVCCCEMLHGRGKPTEHYVRHGGSQMEGSC